MKKIEVLPNGRKRVYTVNLGPDMTDQSQKDDCDVNLIMAKFRKTGSLTHLSQRQGFYADLSSVKDLHSSLLEIQAASSAFALLPAELRKRFNNDMKEYVEFLHNPENKEEAIALGLLLDPKKQEPQTNNVTINDTTENNEAPSNS